MTKEHKIKVIDNFISDEDINIALALFNSEPLEKFKNIPWVNILTPSEKTYAFIKKYSDKALELHKETYNLQVPLYTYEAFLTKWDEGHGTGVHQDNHAGAEMVQLTTVVYLNDDYEGGEIYFPDFDLFIKPKKGQAIIFPAFTKNNPYEHGVNPIKGNERFTIALWHTAIKEYADPYLI